MVTTSAPKLAKHPHHQRGAGLTVDVVVAVDADPLAAEGMDDATDGLVDSFERPGIVQPVKPQSKNSRAASIVGDSAAGKGSWRQAACSLPRSAFERFSSADRRMPTLSQKRKAQFVHRRMGST